MPADRIVISGGLVLVHGKSAARPADVVLQSDTIAAFVPPVTAEAPATIDAA